MEDFKVSGQEVAGNELPVKPTAWSRIKAFFLQEITVELTPKQQEFEDRMNDVLNQEVTFKGIRDFWFQEIKFGK